MPETRVKAAGAYPGESSGEELT